MVYEICAHLGSVSAFDVLVGKLKKINELKNEHFSIKLL